MKKEKVFKEYDESPSGEVYFYNYKEPLMRFDDGYGYLGALIYDSTSDQIQCHYCGKWFEFLGHHIHKEHNMRAAEYKKAVGLNQTTALISERHRAKLIQNGLHAGRKNLRPNRGHTKESRAKISAALRENRAEKQNLNNTCPEQLLKRLVDIYNKLGRTPYFGHSGQRNGRGERRNEVPFKVALVRVYGSVENACKMAGIPYRKVGENLSYETRRKWTHDNIVAWIKKFYTEHNRVPTTTEMPAALYQALPSYGGRRLMTKKALMTDGKFHKVEFRLRYTKPELLHFLRMFEKINGRKPSYSDCKRGLLPNLSRYSYNFGSWKKALNVAFDTV